MYLKIPAGKHLMDLVAVDWFKDSKRIDHVARRQGCAAQVLYSILFRLICTFIDSESKSITYFYNTFFSKPLKPFVKNAASVVLEKYENPLPPCPCYLFHLLGDTFYPIYNTAGKFSEFIFYYMA